MIRFAMVLCLAVALSGCASIRDGTNAARSKVAEWVVPKPPDSRIRLVCEIPDESADFGTPLNCYRVN